MAQKQNLRQYETIEYRSMFEKKKGVIWVGLFSQGVILCCSYQTN